jgi:hypothetical protein
MPHLPFTATSGIAVQVSAGKGQNSNLLLFKNLLVERTRNTKCE